MMGPSEMPSCPNPSDLTTGEAWPTIEQAQAVQGSYMYPNAPPSYPDPSNPTMDIRWPTLRQGKYVQQPYMYPGRQVHLAYNNYIDPSIYTIHDWLPWSIINIFIGWLFAAIIPLIFSILCRNYKSSNNASGARTMSTLALIFNILVTLGGIVGWIALLILLVGINRAKLQ